MNKRKSTRNVQDLKTLLFKSSTSVRLVNLITLYRIVTFPLLLVLVLTHRMDVFKWFLLASFFTDAIDGYLARKYNATSILGAKLDSIGDDLTVLAAIVALLVTHLAFIKEEVMIITILLALFIIQLTSALIRYKRISSFHTYLAKIAAVVTAVFLLSVFFFDTIFFPLFYTACIITAVELIEETILVFILPQWKTNVKGLYWVITDKV